MMYLKDNSSDFEKYCTDKSTKKKLIKIMYNSEVLVQNISVQNIINFCKSSPQLQKKIKFNKSENKIIITNKKMMNTFLKILDDDFLKSNLTNVDY